MLICECGEEDCTEALQVPAADYHAVRQDPRRFLVLDGHEIPDGERVVERRRGWAVVEKRANAAPVVEPRDPRHPRPDRP